MSGCKGLDLRAQVRPGTGLQARGQPVQNIGFPNTAAPQPTLIPSFASVVVRSPIFLQTTFLRASDVSECKG